jgi:hypothetical protein
VKAQDHDPIRRWKAVSDWYAEFSAMHGWEFLSPMVELATWVGSQPFASQLFPGTSHEWLCVELSSEYNLDMPSFSCVTTPDGKFECRYFSRATHSHCREQCPLEWSQKLFAACVEQLLQAEA